MIEVKPCARTRCSCRSQTCLARPRRLTQGGHRSPRRGEPARCRIGTHRPDTARSSQLRSGISTRIALYLDYRGREHICPGGLGRRLRWSAVARPPNALSKQGHEVVLLEAQDHVGGRTNQVLKRRVDPAHQKRRTRASGHDRTRRYLQCDRLSVQRHRTPTSPASLCWSMPK